MMEHNPQAAFKSRKRAAQVFTKPKPVLKARKPYAVFDMALLVVILVSLGVIAALMLPSPFPRVPHAVAVERCAAFDDLMGPLLDNAGIEYPEGNVCAKYID